MSVVARGATLAALAQTGCGSWRAARRTPGARAREPTTPPALGVQDLVVVAVKAPAMAAVAARIAPLLGADTIVLTAMNGVPWWFFDGFGGAYRRQAARQSVDPDGAIAAAIPAAQSIGCVVHASCSLDGPAWCGTTSATG